MKITLAIFAFLSGIAFAADDGSGLKIGANADIVSKIGVAEPSTGTAILQVRELEAALYAPIDHVFDGFASLAAHQETDGAKFEIHEAYFGSTKLIPRSRFKVGQFFLGIGRLNQFHRHDWPFISAPTVHRNFLGEEAAMDSGIEYGWLAPLPFYLDLTVGLTSGYVFGHSHTQGSKPAIPTHYLKLSHFQEGFNGRGGLLFGASYLGRKNNAGDVQNLIGADFTAKWKDDEGMQYLIQSEFWYRIMTLRDQDPTKQYGFYVFSSVPITRELSAGLRFDYFTNPSLKNVLGDPVSNNEMSLTPLITYKTSEFATLRLAYHMMQSRQDGGELSRERMVELQGVFVLGAHPAHEF